MDQSEERSGYRRTWPKWLLIYAVAGGIIYLIVYFAFLRDSGYGGEGGGSGGGQPGGYVVLGLPFASAVWEAIRARISRR